MSTLIHYLVRYGVSLVFLNVFAEQIGMPVPAVPTLIVAGALARNGRMSSTHVILIAAVAASLIADWIWFLLGRRYGYRILRTLCRISLSPDSCVRDTEARFERWGMKSLLVAKFIPGFSTVAPPLAGATNRGTLEFLIYDSIGAFLWAGSAVAAGRVFHRAIDQILKLLESLGGPCGARTDRSGIHARPAAGRRIRRMDRCRLSGGGDQQSILRSEATKDQPSPLENDATDLCTWSTLSRRLG